MTRIAAIIVTHDSERFVHSCLAALRQQAHVERIIVVDAGSRDRATMRKLVSGAEAEFIAIENQGFSRANNVGYAHVPGWVEYVLFLNPDAFIRPGALSRAVEYMENPRYSDVGCLTGRLLGCDPASMQPTGRLDSTGVFRAWYGRWYDRGQGEPDCGQYDAIETVPAACGAFMLCRKSALEQAGSRLGHIFDPDFFLYKEDIELSLRLRKHGWKICYHPDIQVLHCRGWQSRHRMTAQMRRQAALSEVLLYRKHPSCYLGWALGKYIAVRFFNL